MNATLILAATAVAITALVCVTAARAWRGWLDLKRLEFAARRESGPTEDDVGIRIELAGVRERLKKLEEIASGVEL